MHPYHHSVWYLVRCPNSEDDVTEVVTDEYSGKICLERIHKIYWNIAKASKTKFEKITPQKSVLFLLFIKLPVLEEFELQGGSGTSFMINYKFPYQQRQKQKRKKEN